MRNLVLLVRYILIILWIVLGFGIFFIFFLIRPFQRNNSYICAQVIGKVAVWILGIKVEIRNKGQSYNPSSYTPPIKLVNNEKEFKEPVVLIANHQHSIDIFLLGLVFPPSTIAIAKNALFFIPFLGQAYWLTGSLFINRKNHRKAMQTMGKVKEAIQNKKLSIFILPEGTRSWGKGLGRFKKGAFRLALDAQVPIRPVVLSSIHKEIDFGKWPSSGRVIIEILPDIEIKNYCIHGGADNLQQLVDYTHKLYQESIERLDQELSTKETKERIHLC